MGPVAKGALAGGATVTLYLLVVVLTTPALDPPAAASAAVRLNYPIIAGMGIGIGLQMAVSAKSRALGCRLDTGGRALGGNSGGAAATSFFSFFSLVPLGCCGWWLYALSLLPGILGTGASAVLVEHSQTLAYAGLAVVFAFAGTGLYRLRRAQRLQVT